MGHRCVWCGTMPMFLPRREPDHISWSDVLDRTTQALDPATRAGSGASKRGSMRIAPVKYSVGPLPEGCEPLLLISMYQFLHVESFGRVSFAQSRFCRTALQALQNFDP